MYQINTCMPETSIRLHANYITIKKKENTQKLILKKKLIPK